MRLLVTILALLSMCALAPYANTQSAPFPNLPRQESPGRQIGWYQNQTNDAFVKAVETNKPLIIVFGDRKSPFFVKTAETVLPCPHLNQLAGKAVFLIGMPDTDEFARRIAVALKLTDYPTISVIAPPFFSVTLVTFGLNVRVSPTTTGA